MPSQLLPLAVGSFIGLPGLALIGAGFSCLKSEGNAITCMDGGEDTGVESVAVGLGLVAGGAICWLSAYAVLRKMALLRPTFDGTNNPMAFTTACEMGTGTLMLMVGSTMLGFGRLCYRDVSIGIWDKYTAVGILTMGGSMVWVGALLVLIFGYLQSESGGVPSVFMDASTRRDRRLARRRRHQVDASAIDRGDIESGALLPNSTNVATASIAPSGGVPAKQNARRETTRKF